MNDKLLLAAAALSVANILADISDRSGLGDSWNDLDEETQKEIQEIWTNLIFQELKTQLEA